VTHLCVSIAVESPDEIDAALADARRSAERGADLVEWRVDALAEQEGALAHVRRLVRESPVPCIVTVRGAREGGDWNGSDQDRVSFLEALCTAEGEPAPAYVDFELADFQRSANIRQKVELCVSHPAQVRAVGTRLILSAHDFDGRPADLSRRWAAMASADSCAVAKVAWRARSVRDNLEAFELLRTRAKPAVAICMGEAGLMSRVLAPKFGAFLTFAHAGTAADAERAAARASGTAPGQPSVEELVERWGFRRIGPATRVLGVIGWPVAHSRSPEVHNAWFRERGADAVYLPIPVPPEYEHFKATVAELVDFAPLDFRGASVTLPHKEHLVRFVRERGGHVDAIAARIGAANTLLVEPGGAVSCTNTDAPAAVDALCEGMGIERAALREKRVAVLGAGGVARAVAAGLADEGARVVVFNRSEDRARAMCEDLMRGTHDDGNGCGPFEGRIVAGRASEIGCGCFHAFVNCTPVGMAGGPEPDGIPLPDEVPLDGSVTVMDTVYAPRETPLLRVARSRGARTVDGWSMFTKQAERQSRLWRVD
jgi:3-dehydroquinate dehydratase/shikimate dehydrogenase